MCKLIMFIKCEMNKDFWFHAVRIEDLVIYTGLMEMVWQ